MQKKEIKAEKCGIMQKKPCRKRTQNELHLFLMGSGVRRTGWPECGMDGILAVIIGCLFLSGREGRMEEVPCSVPWIRTGWPERGVDGILAVVTGNLSLLGRGSRMVERARRWHRSRTRHQRNARAVNP